MANQEQRPEEYIGEVRKYTAKIIDAVIVVGVALSALGSYYTWGLNNEMKKGYREIQETQRVECSRLNERLGRIEERLNVYEQSLKAEAEGK